MKTVVSRIKNILLNPRDEWLAVKVGPVTHRGIFNYAAVLAAIPPLGAMAGSILFNRNIRDSAVAFSLSSVMMTDMIWYVMYVVNVVITGMIIAAVLSTADSRWSGLRGFTISAYSFTPIALAGCIGVVPHLGWTVYPAVLYGIYLLYLGILLLAEIPKKKAAWFALTAFSAAAVVLGFMNLFEYLLESFLLAKVFT
jgi:hypothetical protein